MSQGKSKPGLDAAYDLDGPDANRQLYRDWATTYDAEFARASGYRFARLAAEAFLAAGGKGPVLDAGCGTGLVGAHLPDGLVLDGVDISAEMLAQARAKGRYRGLFEADLTRPLPFADAAYGGLTSSGTFTHGHVGPEALHELCRVQRPGAVAAITVRDAFFAAAGFAGVLHGLAADGVISAPGTRTERVYEAGAAAPDGHADDAGYVIVFEKL